VKEEVESVHLKDDTSFKEIVRQEQARRRLKGQQPKEKLTVAVKHWQVMRMLEELQAIWWAMPHPTVMRDIYLPKSR